MSDHIVDANKKVETPEEAAERLVEGVWPEQDFLAGVRWAKQHPEELEAWKG